MRKILPLIAIVSVMFSCQDPEDEEIIVQEPEYKILSYTDKKNISITYSYPSIDENGNEITLSSALVAWKPTEKDSVDEIKTVIIGCHITITADGDCPTSYLKSFVTSDAMLYFTLPTQADIPELRRSIVIMPDYEGFGVSKDRIHPYLSQELTARQVADAVKYGLQLYKDLDNGQPFADDWKSICIGYSQGGAVALGTQKYIELHEMDDDLHFAGSFCADGPYDLSTTLRYYFEDDGQSFGVQTKHRRKTTPEPLVIPLLIKGMIDTDPGMKGHSVSNYLSKQFLDTGIMDWISEKEMSTGQIRSALYDMCEKGHTAKDGTIYSPNQMQVLFPEHVKKQSLIGTDYEVTADLTQMFTPELLEYLDLMLQTEPSPENYDIINDLMRALSRNSLTEGWQVKHKIVFLHSKYDTTVPLSNYLTFMDYHPEAKTRFISFGKDEHQTTGVKALLSLAGTTFLEDFTWLFAEK
jgi:hypothetical protein